MSKGMKEYRAAKGYRVVCISLYDADVAGLAQKVRELKAAGVTNANKSALIRFALEHVDLEAAARAMLASRTYQQQFARAAASEAPASSTDNLFDGQPVPQDIA